jgi:prolyl-tRNA editing enzyme YbaK/EbsC (Cys-tRNA(Pro) deacylase)
MVLAVTKLDVNKKVRSLMDGKKVSFASGEQTVALTGMQIGGVTPFGLPEIPLYIDSAVMTQAEVVAGGGNRSTKVLLDPAQLLKLPGALVVEGLALPR